MLLIVERVLRVDEVPPFVCLQNLRMGSQGGGGCRACVNSRAEMEALSVDDLYGIFR